MQRNILPVIQKDNPLSLIEFVALYATMTSLMALSIDAMLPALTLIGEELAVRNSNQTQLIVSMFILGMTIGELVFGPFSDKFGRKITILLGIIIYCGGTIIAMTADSFSQMLIGRIVEGIGISGPKVASRALIRDLYVGNAMARIVSFIMAVFILTPMIAPAFGQLILDFADWRAIFYGFLFVAIGTAIWFWIRQAETLAPEDRTVLKPQLLLESTFLVLKHPKVMAYTITSGLIFGIQLVYLSTSQAMFEDFYGAGRQFPLYFAILAAGIGLASLVNSQLVMRFGLHRLVYTALTGLFALSCMLLFAGLIESGVPRFLPFMILCFLIFSCMGIIFGNISAMSMKYVGRIAGLGASIIGSLSSVVAVITAIAIGRFYNGTVIPLATGFILCSAMALLLVIVAKKSKPYNIYDHI